MEFKLEVVVIPVTDVDRAKAFYADRCGFNVDVDDSPSPAFRVVQLTPPGSGCSVTIGTGIAAMEPGSLKGLQMCVADIDAAHAQYTASGVPVTPVRHHDGTGFVEVATWTDLEQRDTFRLIAHVEQVRLGEGVPEELTLIAREGDPGFGTIHDNEERVLNQRFVGYLRWTRSESGALVPRLLPGLIAGLGHRRGPARRRPRAR